MKIRFDIDEIQRLATVRLELEKAISSAASDAERDALYEELDAVVDKHSELTKEPAAGALFIAENLRRLAEKLDDMDVDLDYSDSIPEVKSFLENLPDELDELIRKAGIFEVS